MPLLAVNANDIDQAGLAVEAELPVSWLEHQLADADVSAAAPGQIRARLSRSGKEVVVRGRVHVDVVTPCARCLGPAPIHVEAELSLLLKPSRSGALPLPARGPLPPSRAEPARGIAGSRPDVAHPKGAPARANAGAAAKLRPEPTKGGRRTKEPEYEFTAEEAEVDTFDGETVLLDPFVREAILLEMPQFPLCSEACPGIRPAAPHAEAPHAEPSADDPRLAPLRALRARMGGEAGANGPFSGAGAPRPAASDTRGTGKRLSTTGRTSRPLRANQTKATPKKTTKRIAKKSTRKE